MAELIYHLIDELRVGGAQTHLLTMLREATAARPDLDHRVLSLFGDGGMRTDFEQIHVPVDVLDLRPQLAKRQFRAAVAAIADQTRRHRPGVVEAHLTWSRLLGLYAAWRTGVPRRIGFEQGDIYMNSIKFRVANYIGQRFADHIIVCSEALRQWVRKTHHVSARKLTVMHNCVDLSRFRVSHDAHLRRRLGFGDDTTLFAAVGTLGRGVNKRMDVCIRAVSDARCAGSDVSLLICGDGDQRADLEALIRELGVSDAARILGMRDDVHRVLTACDGFCHAAPFEPFGIVCIEAMATGLPVVVPDTGGIAEAIDDGITGFSYPALSHEALGAAMRRLQEQPEARRDMGRAARRAVEERFGVEQYIRRLHGLYGVSESLGSVP